MTIKFDALNVGDAIPSYTSNPITRTDLVRYAGASGDFNPLHHDNTFVEMFGLKRVIAHGMLIMGIAGEAVTALVDNKNLRRLSVRFAGMTEPADFNDFENTKNRATITVSGKVSDIYEENGEKRIKCDIVAKDALGSTKLAGFFIAAV
jgi:acyl dehydratase